MIRLAALLWVMGGTVLAGVAVLIVLLTPALQADTARNVLIAAVLGYAVGLPLASSAAKALMAKATPHRFG